MARIQAIQQCDADVVLFVNRGAETLRPVIGAALPFVTWWTEESAPHFTASTPTGPLDVAVVTAPVSAEEKDAGSSLPQRVLRIEPAADARLMDQANRRCSKKTADFDVLIPTDVPDDRPESCGVSLPTHVTLWEAIRRIASERIDRPEPPNAESIVADACRATDVRLDDESVRRQFVQLTEARAQPAARCISLAAACQKAGLRVAVQGRHWRQAETLGLKQIGDTTSPGEILATLNGFIVVLPTSDVSHVQTALDALAGGLSVCLRCHESSFTQRYPGLVELVQLMHMEPTSKRVAARATNVHRDRIDIATSEPDAASDSARSALLAQHTIAARLTWVIDHVRRLQHESNTST